MEDEDEAMADDEDPSMLFFYVDITSDNGENSQCNMSDMTDTDGTFYYCDDQWYSAGHDSETNFGERGGEINVNVTVKPNSVSGGKINGGRDSETNFGERGGETSSEFHNNFTVILEKTCFT